MKLAIAIFKYFPYGGIQKDFMQIVEEAHRRGHKISAYTYEWNGSVPDYVDLHLLPAYALTNHRKAQQFFDSLHKEIRRNPPDLLLGFNRGPGLDVYFAGDNCFTSSERARHSGMYHFFNKRYTVYSQLERDVFAPESRTEILYLVEAQKEQYIKCFHTQENRFHLLPPGMTPDCRRPADASAIRDAKRNELNVHDPEILIVQVAANLMLKGADRLVEAVANLPDELRKHLKICFVGRDSTGRLVKLVEQLNLIPQVLFAGPRDDVQKYLLAADLMVHAARNEAAGTVLIEAIAAGLPVVCTENCGFSKFVADSHSGCVLSGKFDPMELEMTLQSILWNPWQLKTLSKYALEYAEHADFYSRAKVAVDCVEEVQHARHQ